jgi:hypothetical protein
MTSPTKCRAILSPFCPACPCGDGDPPWYADLTLLLEASVFEADYAKASGIMVRQLHQWGRFAEPCDCGEDGCIGWAMGHQLEDAIVEDEVRCLSTT